MSAQEREIIGQRGRQWILANRRYETLAKNYLAILFDERVGEKAVGQRG
jgi:hypothetical protein